MIIKAYIFTSQIDHALESLASLPSRLRPTAFGQDESGAQGDIGNTDDYELFRQANRGFFLFAPEVRYDVTARSNEVYSRLLVEPVVGTLNAAEVLAIFSAFSSSLHFGFACLWAEYCHRNRYCTRFGDNQVQAWVGRDLYKYIPGLYWTTAIARSLIERVGRIPPDKFPTMQRVELAAGVCVIRMYEKPEEWQIYAETIDAFCADHASFFSLNRIRGQLDSTDAFLGLTSVLNEWK